MNTTINTKNTYKDPERTHFIKSMKERLITIKPVRDEIYGNIYQHLFLDDYVLYALLRNKKDFTKTASKKEKAIDSATNICTFLKVLVKDIEKMIEKENISEKEALIKESKIWECSGYYRLNKVLNFTGETPLSSIKMLLEDIENAIKNATI